MFSPTDMQSQSIKKYYRQFDTDDCPFTQAGSGDHLAGELAIFYVIE